MSTEEKIRLCSYLITGSAILCLSISFLLLINYLQISGSDPLESVAMTTLLERLEEEPNNDALKTEIRNLDLLARKAFFNNQWQINTGALLLLISAIIFGIALNVRQKLVFQIEIPQVIEKNDFHLRSLVQRGILIVGAIVLFLALGASFYTKDYLQSFNIAESQAGLSEVAVEQIEIVEVNTGTEGMRPFEQPAVTEPASEDIEPSPLPEMVDEAGQVAVRPEGTFPDLESILKQHGTFRGPLARGVSYHKNIPVVWKPADGTNIIWKTPLPKNGNNSPVIWGDRLFLAGADGGGKIIYCYNRHSGTLLWEKVVNNIPGSPAQSPKVTDDTGLSAPTLTTDGLSVYAIFATGDIISLDLSGKEVWSRNLGVPDNHYGHSSSLVSWKEKLFVQYDTNLGGKVMALDCRTGQTIWETEREVKISWSSPILASVGDKLQLVLASDPLVAAYDLDSGKELWSVDCMMGEVGPAPAWGSGLVFAANEYAKLVAIRPGTNAAAIVWESNEYLPEVASPVVADGLLFIGTSYGVLAAYDAQSGEKQWEHECSSGFYASPMVADGKLYALDREGVMHIFKVDKEKNLIGEPELGEETVTTPAFAPGRIYIRGEKNLYCIGND
ncbi:MAG: PQQ-binding-like beta-propeller repeat protein [Saprospiraceae bacterium]|nr:PQQ-binding-like beta-propeller repeat protein [Saprospiraceae bacterium]